jgi:hypothetical protein
MADIPERWSKFYQPKMKNPVNACFIKAQIGDDNILKDFHHVRSEVFTAVNMKNAVF